MISVFNACRELLICVAATGLCLGCQGSGPIPEVAPAGDEKDLLGIWRVTYEDGGTLSLFIPGDGSAGVANHSYVGLAELKLITGDFTHRLDGHVNPKVVEFLRMRHGELQVERHEDSGSVLSGTGVLVSMSVDPYKPLPADFMRSTCRVELLSASCRNERLPEELLHIACAACRASACANRWSLFHAAYEVAKRRTISSCPEAVAAAIAILAQFNVQDPRFDAIDMSLPDAISDRQLEEQNGEGQVSERGPGLKPFPFNVDHVDLFQRFTPVPVDPPCVGDPGAEVRTEWNWSSPNWQPHGRWQRNWSSSVWRDRPKLLAWFRESGMWSELTSPALLPRSADLVKVQCPVVASDHQLAARCRRRLARASYGSVAVPTKMRSLARSPLHELCPSNGTTFSRVRKYADHDLRSCSTGFGTWGKRIESRLKCIAVVVAELLGLQPGDRVLDWGSGCGWTLTWLRVLYGIEGFGIEAVQASVAWAKRYSAGDFCFWSSPDLRWVPDQSFDAVVSYWALYHLKNPEEICRVARQLVNKLRPGGRAWFGGNCVTWSINIVNTRMSEVAWRRCFRAIVGEPVASRQGKSRSSFEVDFFDDAELFEQSGFAQDDDPENPGSYLFWPPVFSVLVRRLA